MSQVAIWGKSLSGKGRASAKYQDVVKLQEGRRRTRWQEGSKLGKYWEMRSEEDVSFYSESSEELCRVVFVCLFVFEVYLFV